MVGPSNSSNNTNTMNQDANLINVPLYIANSDNPSMVLTNTPFNGDVNCQRWIRCNYMVTCWILNSMIDEPSDAFLYVDSDYELWKEIYERYGLSNRPLIYQIERELSNVVQGNLSVAAYFNKMKRSQILSMDPLPNVNKAYYIIQQVKKQRHVTTTFHEPTIFYAKNTQYNKKEDRGGIRNDKRFCTNCQQDGHTSDQCFEKIGYPDS
ncbi:hypothetical protein Tco_0744496 [Tanacetum coccineum]